MKIGNTQERLLPNAAIASPRCPVPPASLGAELVGRRTPTYLELTELRRPTGEKSTGELTADPRDRPLRLALGVDAGPIPTSGPRRVPGPGVHGEETPGNMSAGSRGNSTRGRKIKQDLARQEIEP